MVAAAILQPMPRLQKSTYTVSLILWRKSGGWKKESDKSDVYCSYAFIRSRLGKEGQHVKAMHGCAALPKQI
jgi:hypothetical protein